jgi:hypothetical protein
MQGGSTCKGQGRGEAREEGRMAECRMTSQLYAHGMPQLRTRRYKESKIELYKIRMRERHEIRK